MKENELNTEEERAQFLIVIRSTGNILDLYKKKDEKEESKKWKQLHTTLSFY